MESTLREYNSRESEIWGVLSPTLGNTCLAYYYTAAVNWRLFTFYGVFDCYFHIPLPIGMKHELGLPFPPRNLPIKFGTNPSTIFLVIVVTDRHTDRHTNQRR